MSCASGKLIDVAFCMDDYFKYEILLVFLNT